MFKDTEYFLKKLQSDTILYNIFKFIGEYSTVYHEEFNFLQENKIKLKDAIANIKSNVVNKSDEIIQGYIDELIKYGLCKYVVENDEDSSMMNNKNAMDDTNILSYYKNLGYPKEDAEIILTSSPMFGEGEDHSGISLFKEIISNNEMEEISKNFGNALESGVEGILKPYDDKIEKLNKELENKINELNHMVDSGVIKNIQVISVFAGIISLLFANVMGIKEFSTIGVKGLLILNFSMVISIFALILFSKLLIVGGEIKTKIIFYCLLIILLIAIPIFLF